MNSEKKPQACSIAYGFCGFVDVDLDVIVISIPSLHIPSYQGIPVPHRLQCVFRSGRAICSLFQYQLPSVRRRQILVSNQLFVRTRQPPSLNWIAGLKQFPEALDTQVPKTCALELHSRSVRVK